MERLDNVISKNELAEIMDTVPVLESWRDRESDEWAKMMIDRMIKSLQDFKKDYDRGDDLNIDFISRWTVSDVINPVKGLADRDSEEYKAVYKVWDIIGDLRNR